MPAPVVQISTRALTLRPVAARVVSYGRSNKMAQRATLYVIRVARGGREWFVARRFSEFRSLDAALRLVLSRPHAGVGRSRVCAQCRELARRMADVSFPSRFPIRSSFASTREKIESMRLQQLDAFVQLLMETTQGLLANQDDDDDEYDEEDDEEEMEYDGCGGPDDDAREDRCDALRIVREFLLVHDHLLDDKSAQTQQEEHQDQNLQVQRSTTTTAEQQCSTAASGTAAPPQRRPRLTSSGSLGTTTTTFRVQELDAMYRPASPLSPWMALRSGSSSDLQVPQTAASPNVLDDHELDALFLADYASPAQDAVIHRQLEEADKPPTHVLRRAESMRSNRWGL